TSGFGAEGDTPASALISGRQPPSQFCMYVPAVALRAGRYARHWIPRPTRLQQRRRARRLGSHLSLLRLKIMGMTDYLEKRTSPSLQDALGERRADDAMEWQRVAVDPG